MEDTNQKLILTSKMYIDKTKLTQILEKNIKCINSDEYNNISIDTDCWNRNMKTKKTTDYYFVRAIWSCKTEAEAIRIYTKPHSGLGISYIYENKPENFSSD